MRLKVSDVCQLLDKSKFPATHTQLGCTFTNNGDGSFTINGTIQNGGSWSNPLQQITQNLYGHKILLLTNSTSDIVRGEMKLTLQNGSSKWGTYNSIYTVIYDDYKYIAIRIYMDNVDAGKTIDNATVKFQLFDLTEMYGAGNEPTTVEQFRQDFPNEMYDYSPECWKKFRRLKYIANKEPVQLLDKSTYKNTINNGITYTPNIEDGTWTITGTGTNFSFCGIQSLRVGVDFEVGDKVLLRNSHRDDTTYFVFAPYYDSNGNYLGEKDGAGIFTILNNTVRIPVQLTTRVTGVALNITTQVQLFNLTRMYGKGNEPTTAEFGAQYPGFDYPVNKYNYLTLNRGKYIANKEPVQLLDKSKFKAVTSKNVTATPDITNGMWTISGAATASEYLQIGVYYPGTNFDIGDKLFLRHSNIDNSLYFPFVSWYDKDHKYLGEYDGMGVFPVTNPKTAYIACYFTTRTVGDINVTTQVQLFNLTRMYGKGNEPTAAEFVAQYPGFDYSVNKYNAITFR